MQPECTNGNRQSVTTSYRRELSRRHLAEKVAGDVVDSVASHDAAADSEFLKDVVEGLSRPCKELHCKYFYDARGSQLFDQICELDEYYPMRIETQIMETHAEAMSDCIGAEAVVVEYGSGSSTKTRILLDSLKSPHAYLPVDISENHLLRTVKQLRRDYLAIDIHPIVADFTKEFEIPTSYLSNPITVYFPGSTIGNLEQHSAMRLLDQIAGQINGQGAAGQGGLLIGVDLDKAPAILQRAYDDSSGVTSEFNLNLLHRINRELNGDFDVSQFKHRAIVNGDQSRVEIYIESLQHQFVQIGEFKFEFQQGELIFTEYSHKYQIDQFVALAEQAGFAINHVWTDSDQFFAVLHFVLQ